ncbi:hypothetical protein ACEPAG_3435 [Sanghuangporus baumii]
MSDQNNGGNSGSGNTPRPSNSGPRIGRIGQWGSSGSTPSNSRSSSAPRFATLGDLNSSSSRPSHPPGHFPAGDDNSSDDDNRREGQTWFTGGERSGLSVQNPNRGQGGSGGPMGESVQSLIRKAIERGHAPSRAAESGNRRAFGGTGHTLGSDDVESQIVPDPNRTPESAEDERAIRHIAFWRNGFTIENGPLLSYDDPRNAEILRALDTGEAPTSILNVRYGQAVDLHVDRRMHEDYVAPQRSHQVFEGAGQRLGAPTPPIVGAGASSSSAIPAASTSAGTTSRADEADSLQTKFEVDQSKPTTSIQVRLADGTRMICRVNLTHTIRDIRNFINASRPENLTRSYSISTVSTFPNRVLDDDAQTIEAAKLQNSVVVQRWV